MWQDDLGQEKIYGAVGGAGLVGDMPYFPYFRKLERTVIPETRELLQSEMRRTLMDRSSDQPNYESEFKSERQYSQAALNLRFGGTRGEPGLTPYLPDGTFLDQEYLHDGKNEPDFSQYRRHTEHRIKQIQKNFGPDSALTTTESILTPGKLTELRRADEWRFKERLQFTDGKDAFAAGRTRVIDPDSRVRYYSADGTLIDSNESSNYKDPASFIEAKRVAGWNAIVDGEFKIAKYSMRRKAAAKSQGPKATALTDGKKSREMGELKNLRPLVLDAHNFMRRKANDTHYGEQFAKESVQEGNRKVDTRKPIGGYDDRSTIALINAFEKEMHQRKLARFANDKTRIGCSDLSRAVTELAEQQNRKLKQDGETYKIRFSTQNMIDGSQARSDEASRGKKKAATDTNDIQRRTAIMLESESKTVANYKGLKATDVQRLKMINTDQSTVDQLFNPVYKVRPSQYEGLKAAYFDFSMSGQIDDRTSFQAQSFRTRDGKSNFATSKTTEDAEMAETEGFH